MHRWRFFASACLAAGLVVAACAGATNSPDSDSSSSPHQPTPSGSTQLPPWLANLPEVEIECADGGSGTLYQRRIKPLFAEDRPASCGSCHLAGLDLGIFVRDTPCETLACLVSQGLVDLGNPDDSTVLSWIGRSEPQSTLITEQVIVEEYQGFREWIHYNAECGECSDVACPSTHDGPFCPDEPLPREGIEQELAALDPGGCGDAALLQVFKRSVYAARGRCSPCHYNSEDFALHLAPQWINVTGDCESASRRSYWNVLDSGYLDVENPEQSLLLLKPLDEDLGGVPHGGHDKFWSLTDDPGYLSFLYFTKRYAACRTDN